MENDAAHVENWIYQADVHHRRLALMMDSGRGKDLGSSHCSKV
jgi:hypothetical protein